MTGPVEQGVRKTLRDLGIDEPATAVETLAVWIAKQLDSGVEEKNAAALSRELRLTLRDVADQISPDEQNETDKLLNKER